MDAIFKALNDPARRALLDSLRRKDGQSLSDLEAQLEMTRFGVMKHLKVLEDAFLVVTKREGRFKYHYLNAVPLQEVIDRWIEPLLAKPAARSLIDLKTRLEKESPMPADKPDLIVSTFINCTQDALWEALTRADEKARYHFASPIVQGDLAAIGDEMRLLRDDGSVMLTERLISLSPKSRIETSFLPGWVEASLESRCVFLLEPDRSGMKLTVEHYRLGAEHGGTHDGWNRVFAGLKTYLETGTGHRFVREAMPA